MELAIEMVAAGPIVGLLFLLRQQIDVHGREAPHFETGSNVLFERSQPPFRTTSKKHHEGPCGAEPPDHGLELGRLSARFATSVFQDIHVDERSKLLAGLAVSCGG